MGRREDLAAELQRAREYAIPKSEQRKHADKPRLETGGLFNTSKRFEGKSAERETRQNRKGHR